MKPKIKIRKLYYTISEVSELLNLKQQTIRYWETVITELKPQKNRSGNRIYKADDINVIKLVRYLVMGEKMTIHDAEEKIKTYKSQRLYKTMINTVSREEDKGSYLKDEADEQIDHTLLSEDEEESGRIPEKKDMEPEPEAIMEVETEQPQQPLFVFGDDSHDIDNADINLVTLEESKEDTEETLPEDEQGKDAEIPAEPEDDHKEPEAVQTPSEEDLQEESLAESENIPEDENDDEIKNEDDLQQKEEHPAQDTEPCKDHASADSVDADSLYRLLENISANIREIRDILNE